MSIGLATGEPAQLRTPGARFGSMVPVPFPVRVKKRQKPTIFDDRTISSRKCHAIGRFHVKIEPEPVGMFRVDTQSASGQTGGPSVSDR